MSENGKRVCGACNWSGKESDLLVAKNPFTALASHTITGCPWCKDVDSIYTICDEPGCWEPDTCGTPSPEGYRRVCGNHYHKLQLLESK